MISLVLRTQNLSPGGGRRFLLLSRIGVCQLSWGLRVCIYDANKIENNHNGYQGN